MAKLSLTAVRARSEATYRSTLRGLRRRRAARALADGVDVGSRLHLGCGSIHLDGWINIDVGRHTAADLRIDLRGGLPVAPGSVSRIYSEHFIEHLSLDDGVALLKDCWRALQPGGVLRLATPDLRAVVDAYLGEWREQAWLQDSPHSDILTPAEMLNTGLREWGHVYVYDREDLAMRLEHAGFSDVRRCEWGESSFADLRGLEVRADSLLILEAVR